MPSKVLALVVTQLPAESSKHPAESLIPLLNDDVADEERLMDPPVMVRPEEELRPAPEMPPANVEVAVEEELMPPASWRREATFNLPPIVEEALVKSPPTNWERFCTEREEEAEIAPPT